MCAYAAGAVTDTMGGAGILVRDKAYPLLAELLDRLERDELLRGRVLAAQGARLEEFGPDAFERALRGALEGLLEGARS